MALLRGRRTFLKARYRSQEYIWAIYIFNSYRKYKYTGPTKNESFTYFPTLNKGPLCPIFCQEHCTYGLENTVQIKAKKISFLYSIQFYGPVHIDYEKIYSNSKIRFEIEFCTSPA